MNLELFIAVTRVSSVLEMLHLVRSFVRLSKLKPGAHGVILMLNTHGGKDCTMFPIPLPLLYYLWRWQEIVERLL